MITKINKICIILSIVSMLLLEYVSVAKASESSTSDMRYIDFLQEVYIIMDKNYYKPVSKKIYENFEKKYTLNVLKVIKEKSGMDYKIAHFAAGLLVNELKSPTDYFTKFIPPKEAAEFAKEVYGYENGIGIEGAKHDGIYLIEKVQKRSNAHKKGISKGDLLIEIEGHKITDLTDKELQNFLYPDLGTEIKIKISHTQSKCIKTYAIKCVKFFEETIEIVPTNIEEVHYLKIRKFNRMTGEDLKEYLRCNNPENITHLVLDITGNPGGPPLAVHEISGIFLSPHKNLFYYKKKNIEEFGLRSPESDIRYENKLIIVVDEKSGSASELFAGTMKTYRRALIMGKSPTAGLAELKSIFDFDDGSIVAMLTGQAYIFDGTLIDRNGISPDLIIPKDTENIENYILKQIQISLKKIK